MMAGENPRGAPKTPLPIQVWHFRISCFPGLLRTVWLGARTGKPNGSSGRWMEAVEEAQEPVDGVACDIPPRWTCRTPGAKPAEVANVS